MKMTTLTRVLITCPSWHVGTVGKTWLFCDEIIDE